MIVRLNGTLKNRGTDEVRVELEDGIQLLKIVKIACKQFGSKENYNIAKIYNKGGI